VPGTNDNVSIIGNITVTLNSDTGCGSLTFGSPVTTPTLSGTGTLTLHRNSTWTAGSMTGGGKTIVDSGAKLTIPGPTTIFVSNGRTLENGGNVLWSGTGFFGLFAATITNRPGAFFDVNGSGSIYLTFGNPSRFDNAGSFRKIGTPGTTTVGNAIAFNNYGVVDIQSGTLSWGGGGFNGGDINLSAGATLDLAGGAVSATPDSSLTGTGNLTVSGAAATLAGLVNVSGTNTFSGGGVNFTGSYFCTNNTLIISGGTANFDATGTVAPNILTLSGGTLGGTEFVTVRGLMNWAGGSMTGSTVTLIPTGVTVFITNSTVLLSGSRTLDNAGTIFWSGSGSIGVFGSVITNRPGALFDAESSGSMYLTLGGPSRFDNAGTFRKAASASTLTVSAGIAFNNYGALVIQKGILAASGGYVGAPNALLKCSLAGTNAGIDYGQLQAGGPVTLQGALSVDLVGNFLPVTNSTFTVLTAGSRTGSFANFVYPSNLVTMQLSNSPNSVVVRTIGVLAIPRPVLLPPEILGGNVLLSWTANAGTTYRVEFKPDLSLSNWAALSGDVSATNGLATRLDPLISSNRLYRVRVVP
jgi:hypothetical protein